MIHPANAPHGASNGGATGLHAWEKLSEANNVQRIAERTAQLVNTMGSRVWVRATGEPVRNEQGTIIALQDALQDIPHKVAVRKCPEGPARQHEGRALRRGCGAA